MIKLQGTDFNTQTGRVIFTFVTIAGDEYTNNSDMKEVILRDLLNLERGSLNERDFQIAIADLYSLRVKSDTALYDTILHEAVIKTARVLEGFSKIFYSCYFDLNKKAIPYECFMICLHADTSFKPSGLAKNIETILGKEGD